MQNILSLILLSVVFQACTQITGRRDNNPSSDANPQNSPHPNMHGWSAITEEGAPSTRYRPTVLQQGSNIIIFGGYGENSILNDGAIYDLQANTWTNIPSHGQNRSMNSAGLAGEHLIVWGGDTTGNWRSVSGVKFKIGSDHWEPISTINAPSARYLTPAFSLGNKLLIWGGHPNCDIVDGKIYDPAKDVWQSVPPVPVGTTAGCDNVYFDKNKLFVWGHYTEDPNSSFSNGAIYDTRSNSWEIINIEGQPSEREFPLLLATEKYFVVWGGRTRYREGAIQKDLSNGGIYDIASKKWTLVSDDSGKIPGGAQPAGVLMNDHSILIWGGAAFSNTPSNHGGILDLTSATWLPVSSNGAPTARNGHFIAAVDDHRTLVFGGFQGTQGLFDGSIFDSTEGRWNRIDENPGMAPRNYAAMQWTGEGYQSLFLWGGNKVEKNNSVLVSGGGVWRP